MAVIKISSFRKRKRDIEEDKVEKKMNTVGFKDWLTEITKVSAVP